MRQALGPGALGRPGGSGWRGRWEGGSGWGRHVNSRLFHKKEKKKKRFGTKGRGMKKKNHRRFKMVLLQRSVSMFR